MKQLFVIALAFILAGCGAIPPASTSATPQVVVQTVVVTVIPTQAPTEVPTSTPASTQTPAVIVVTATGGAPETGATQQPQAAVPVTGVTPSATLPANAGGDLFTSLTRSGDHFALRCLPEDITFSVSTANETVTSVDIYYRIEDRLSVSISNWINGGTMTSDKNGNFTMDFPASRVDPDVRSHKAWFDYQFVGLNKGGGAVGRSARIVKQITYTIDCSD